MEEALLIPDRSGSFAPLSRVYLQLMVAFSPKHKLLKAIQATFNEIR